MLNMNFFIPHPSSFIQRQDVYQRSVTDLISRLSANAVKLADVGLVLLLEVVRTGCVEQGEALSVDCEI